MNFNPWWQNLPGPLKAAFVFGAVPLLLGVSVYLAWLITRWNWLIEAGIYAIISGLLCFVIGLTGLCAYFIQRKHQTLVERQRGNRPAILAALLLFSNFPSAWFCLSSAIDIHSRSTIAIINQSNSPVLGLTLIGPDGTNKQVPSILPGEKVHQYLRSFREGEIKFTCTQPSITNGLVESYDMGGGSYVLLIKADGTYSVERRKG